MRKILIVSEKVADGDGLRARLLALGYGVVDVLRSVGEAAAALTAAAPDLVLISLSDGQATQGAEWAAELRRHDGIPVLLMVPEADEDALHSAGVTEAHAYVVDTCSDRELRLTLEFARCRYEEARAIRELENRFFTVSVDMLCFLDFSGHFKRLNPAWERTLGFTVEELKSRPFIEFVHPDDRERTLNQNAAVRGGGQALAFENRYLCKDGSYRWFRWNAAPDSGHSVIYSVARDVTEEKRAADERERLVGELQAALAEVKALQKILPLCSYCRKIRDDENYWQTVESYIGQHTSTRFSHGICPECMDTVVSAQIAALDSD